MDSCFQNTYRQEAGEVEEVLVHCRAEKGYFIPVLGDDPVLDNNQRLESDVPGGAPVIIEDFFKDRFWIPPAREEAAKQEVDKSQGDDLGVNFWYIYNPPSVIRMFLSCSKCFLKETIFAERG